MRIFFLILLLYCAHPICAQTCCSGGVPLSNNLGLPNEGKGTMYIGLNYDHNNLNTLNAGVHKLNDDSRLRVTNAILLNLGYSISDRLSLEGLFTWVNQTRTISQFGNENFTETKGIGDAVFLVKYAVPNLIGQSSTLHIGVGTKVPLGASDLTTPDGFQLTADLQPGSGAWDGIGWLSLSKELGFRPSAMLSGSMTYRLTGKNREYLNETATYEFGNELQLNFGYTDQILLCNTIFDPGLILKYRRASNDKIDNSGIPNTGGEWFFLRPEIGARLTPNMLLSARLEVPVYSYVEGTQLTPTLRFTAGISLRLNKKEINVLN